MKGTLIILFVVFSVMEFMAWKVYTASKEEKLAESPSQNVSALIRTDIATVPPEETDADTAEDAESSVEESVAGPPAGDAESGENATYPRISVEEKNGVTERTIHMGVRQWAWDPAEIRAKQGELVRLVIHNADIRHAIVIPDLGVEADIPEEGAIVEFTASQRGTFDFLCATYCGTGHAMMQGRIVVE